MDKERKLLISIWSISNPFVSKMHQSCGASVVFPCSASLPRDSKRPSSLCDNKHRCYPCLISHMHATLYGEKCAGEKTWNIGVSRPVCFRRINNDRHSHTTFQIVCGEENYNIQIVLLNNSKVTHCISTDIALLMEGSSCGDYVTVSWRYWALQLKLDKRWAVDACKAILRHPERG